jgi:hypothetical protein
MRAVVPALDLAPAKHTRAPMRAFVRTRGAGALSMRARIRVRRRQNFSEAYVQNRNVRRWGHRRDGFASSSFEQRLAQMPRQVIHDIARDPS